MSKKRKILVTLESRATYGYAKNVMMEMDKFPSLELQTLVTGMHLVPELGNSVDLIESDGFPINYKVPLHGEDASESSWSQALGEGINGFAKAFEQAKPDIILLSGDRVETFGCCIAAAYMGIPIAHIQAGDKSGHIDDSARHAIGKFAHIHLASCQDSVDRLIKMGEQEFRIFNVGAPQLDNIENYNFHSDSVEIDSENIDLSKPYILMVQHPVMAEIEDAGMQINETIQACKNIDLPTFIIYPNSDLGYKKIVDGINKSKSSNFKILRNVERDAYLRLLANCSVLVGNSSSGILEAPSFKIPVINIGNRQRGRPQASNIVNCEFNSEKITSQIKYCIEDVEYIDSLDAVTNLYGDGKSSKRICDILSTIEINKSLIDKECTY